MCRVLNVVNINGQPNRQIVDLGITGLSRLFHGGFIEIDGVSNHGSGFLTDTPQPLMQAEFSRLTGQPAPDMVYAGMFHMPLTDDVTSARIQEIIEDLTQSRGFEQFVWREVPMNREIQGPIAKASMPAVKQLLVAPQINKENGQIHSREKTDYDLWVVGRKIENAVTAEGLLGEGNNRFDLQSFGSRLVTKGMILPQLIPDLFTDLKDERFVSSVVLGQNRAGTIKGPVPFLAQPFEEGLQNGEFTTMESNRRKIMGHMDRFKDEFGDDWQHVKNIIQPGNSDGKDFMRIWANYRHAGLSPAQIHMLLMRDTIHESTELDDRVRMAFRRTDALGHEYYGGPSALGFYDGNEWYATGDPDSGIRPLRGEIFKDGILVLSSELGSTNRPPELLFDTFNLAPEDAISVRGGKIRFSNELKQEAASLYNDAELEDTQNRLRPFKVDGPIYVSSADKTETSILDRETLFKQIRLAGISRQEIELIINTQAVKGREAKGAMTPGIVKPPFSHNYNHDSGFFKREILVYTAPTYDHLRQSSSMELSVMVANINGKIEKLDSPLLLGEEWTQFETLMADSMERIECLFDIEAAKQNKKALREKRAEIVEQALRILRSGKSVQLDDLGLADYAANTFMIFTVGEIYAAAEKERLLTGNKFIAVRSAECHDGDYVGKLIQAGAKVVNPWLSEKILEHECQEGKYQGTTLDEAFYNLKKSMEWHLYGVLGAHGLTRMTALVGAGTMEADGVNWETTAGNFPAQDSPISGWTVENFQKMKMEHHLREIDYSSLKRLNLPILSDSASGNGRVDIIDSYGYYQPHHEGEAHADPPDLIERLWQTCQELNYEEFKLITEEALRRRKKDPIYDRDLFDLKEEYAMGHHAISHEEAPSLDCIVSYLYYADISEGGVAAWVKRHLEKGARSVGADAYAGEGGVAPSVLGLNDSGPTSIQNSTAGFGDSIRKTDHATTRIVHKTGQGAKPMVGGDMPGHKVNPYIANLRGVPVHTHLPSSSVDKQCRGVEDGKARKAMEKSANWVAQLVDKFPIKHDIASSTLAAACGGADEIIGVGQGGRTASAKHVDMMKVARGIEPGIARMYKVLKEDGRIQHQKVAAESGLRWGSDSSFMMSIGANRIGFGAFGMVALGCDLQGGCNIKCSQGLIMNGDEDMINPQPPPNYKGKPEFAANYLTMQAMYIQEFCALVGARSIEELNDMRHIWQQTRQLDRGFDFSKSILQPVSEPDEHHVMPEHLKKHKVRVVSRHPRTGKEITRLEPIEDPLKPEKKSWDFQIIDQHGDAIKNNILSGNTPYVIEDQIDSTMHNVGVALSSFLAQNFNDDELKTAWKRGAGIKLQMTGAAGLHYNSYLIYGVETVANFANDFAFGHMSGGHAYLVHDPKYSSLKRPSEALRLGNVGLTKAAAGTVFIDGVTGNDLINYNRGAKLLAMQTGDNFFNFGFAGFAGLLGTRDHETCPVGHNAFTANVGGQAIIIEPDLERLEKRLPSKGDHKIYALDDEMASFWRQQVEHMANKTNSNHASWLLDKWDNRGLKYSRLIRPDALVKRMQENETPQLIING